MKSSISVRSHLFSALNLAAILLALLATGCAATKSALNNGAHGKTESPASIAAADFATNLAAMLDPERTGQAIYFPPTSAEFGLALHEALQRVGFSLARVKHELAPTVAFEVSARQTQQGASNDYRLSVGSLLLSRTYVQDSSGIYPATALLTDMIDGATEPLTVASSSTGSFGALTDTSASQRDIPLSRGHTPVTPSAVQVNTVGEQQTITPDLPSNLDGIERQNMHETRVSSFAKFTRGYKGIYKQVLAFPNDSLAMSDDVMSELNQFADRFKPETDVLSVIGCSHGNTALENGNALLAIGRSKRVRQYLVEQGIPVNRVLDEGCWAPVHFDEKMPRRGVVVELKRKAT